MVVCCVCFVCLFFLAGGGVGSVVGLVLVGILVLFTSTIQLQAIFYGCHLL